MTSRIDVQLSAGDRITASFDGISVATDQDGSAPSPFDLFLASIATCAGFYVSSFCRSRGLSPEGIRITQNMTRDPATGLVDRIAVDIDLPAGFPPQYRDAVVRAAGACAVKKHLEKPPRIEVVARLAAPS